MQQLSFHRIFHMKEWTARLAEALEVEVMKDAILGADTKFQLGRRPRMGVQFDFFVVNSLLALKAKNKEGAIV